MHKNIQIKFTCSPKRNLPLDLEKTLWVLSYSMCIQLEKSSCGHTSCWGFWGSRDVIVHWECSCAVRLLSLALRVGVRDLQDGSAHTHSLFLLGGRFPWSLQISTVLKEKAEHIKVNMVCFCLGIAAQDIISMRHAVLLKFISVAVCRTIL